MSHPEINSKKGPKTVFSNFFNQFVNSRALSLTTSKIVCVATAKVFYTKVMPGGGISNARSFNIKTRKYQSKIFWCFRRERGKSLNVSN